MAGTAVQTYSPSSPANTSYSPPQRQIVLRNVNYSSTTQAPSGGGSARRQRATVYVNQHSPRGNQKWGLLADGNVTVYAWVIAMGVIAWDEWKNNGIFPRPSRLWYATLFYGLLALAGLSSALVPLMNALAVGYTIMLLWQYYNKQGQFS